MLERIRRRRRAEGPGCQCLVSVCVCVLSESSPKLMKHVESVFVLDRPTDLDWAFENGVVKRVDDFLPYLEAGPGPGAVFVAIEVGDGMPETGFCAAIRLASCSHGTRRGVIGGGKEACWSWGGARCR